MATDPNEHPAHKVPETYPLPPGDLPPSTETPTIPRSPSSPNQGRTTLAKLRMKVQILWARRPGPDFFRLRTSLSPADAA